MLNSHMVHKLWDILHEDVNENLLCNRENPVKSQ